MTSTSPAVATTSPSHSPGPLRSVVAMLTGGQPEHQVGQDGAEHAADQLRGDRRRGRPVVTEAGGAFEHGDDRVERGRHRLQDDDQHGQRSTGGDRVLQQLQPGIGRRQPRGGDPGADHRGHQEPVPTASASSRLASRVGETLYGPPPHLGRCCLGRCCLGRCCLGRCCLGRCCLGRCCLGRCCLGRCCLGRRRLGRCSSVDAASVDAASVDAASVDAASVDTVGAARVTGRVAFRVWTHRLVTAGKGQLAGTGRSVVMLCRSQPAIRRASRSTPRRVA